MRRRIVINLLIAFTLIPLIVCIKDYLEIGIQPNNRIFSGTYREYVLGHIPNLLLIIPLVFLFLVLLPYNIAIIKLDKTKKRTILYKAFIFELIFSIAFGLFGSSGWALPLEMLRFILYFIPISILFASILHWLVDQKGY